MANAVNGVLHAQQVAQVTQTRQNPPTTRPPKQDSRPSVAPQDTVTISAAGKAASQTQNGQTGNDRDSDGK